MTRFLEFFHGETKWIFFWLTYNGQRCVILTVAQPQQLYLVVCSPSPSPALAPDPIRSSPNLETLSNANRGSGSSEGFEKGAKLAFALAGGGGVGGSGDGGGALCRLSVTQIMRKETWSSSSVGFQQRWKKSDNSKCCEMNELVWVTSK